MLIGYSQDKQDVEGAEEQQNEEDLHHQLPIAAHILMNIPQNCLRPLQIVERTLCIRVNSLY